MIQRGASVGLVRQEKFNSLSSVRVHIETSTEKNRLKSPQKLMSIRTIAVVKRCLFDLKDTIGDQMNGHVEQ